MELKVRNVNQALAKSVRLLMSSKDIISVSPRGAATYEWDEPVLTIYERPMERVLFSGVRDANPFFHFFESLWMLAGRNDIKFVASFVKRMKQFSDDGETQPGAYGKRWRSWFKFDQIQRVIAELKRDPATRRVVLTMWDPQIDLGPQGHHHRESKDLPCNTHVYFKVRNGALNMTVCCRSNDIIWGAYGANAVHFSMLQEYIAAKVGVRVGRYHQLSDSWHVYTGGDGGKVWNKLCETVHEWPAGALNHDPYEVGMVRPLSIGAQHPEWDSDLATFFKAYDTDYEYEIPFSSPWFKHVVNPIYIAWVSRERDMLDLCMAEDWRLACQEWMARRVTK